MPVPCARCNSALPLSGLTDSDTVLCGACGSKNTVRVFPSLIAAPTAPASENALEGEAACFDHPSKRAVAACHHCGRFVCALCSVEFSGQLWCPTCVATSRGQTKSAYLDTSRILFDSIALSTPLLSLFLWPLTVITGPGTVVFSAMTWKKPLSLVRRNRWRFVVATILGAGETVGWIWLIIYMWLQMHMGRT